MTLHHPRIIKSPVRGAKIKDIKKTPFVCVQKDQKESKLMSLPNNITQRIIIAGTQQQTLHTKRVISFHRNNIIQIIISDTQCWKGNIAGTRRTVLFRDKNNCLARVQLISSFRSQELHNIW